MRKYTLGLCLIVKDEQENITRLLDNICGHVDHVYLTDTGSSDKTIEYAKNICADHNQPITISHFKWEDNFATARNFNFDQAETDWILWLDADDTVENPEKLRDYIDFAEGLGVNSIQLIYRYLVDEAGNNIAAHAKDRIFKRGMFEWTSKAPIHENAFIKPEYEHLKKFWYPSDETVKIRHWATLEDLKRSGERNLRILKALERKEGKHPDPRTVFLLGREYEAHNDPELAKKYLLRYIEIVKYGHERAQALGLLCKLSEQEGNFDKELDYAFESLKSDPSLPLPYVMIATAYSNMGKYAEVQDWLAKALQKDYKYSAGEIQTQRGLERQIAFLLADSYDNNKEYEKAAKALQSYASTATEDERNEIQGDLNDLKVKSVVQKQLDSFKVLANVALKMDKLETVKNLIKILPASLLDELEVVRLKRALGMNKEWQKQSVVIFAGIGLEEWDQDSTDKGGIGGSETAVIEMAKRWGEAGYEVTVYGAVKETKVFGNVTYLPVQEINWADRFNIFISWRNPVVVKSVDIWAKKLYVWLHDVPYPKHYTLDVINKVDKIIVLSNYHRSLLPSVPDDKIYVSRNGIDIKTINEVINYAPDRNMRRMVFTSSPDRGLETLLDMLPAIKQKAGEVEVVWAYGWDNFDKIRHDADGKKWKSDMQAKMRKLGVIEAGRLNKHGLYKLLCSSGYWVYPTRFPEINCISVQEAQACGCYPISSGFAALKETQKIGVMEMDNDIFQRKLIQLLNKSPEVPVRDWGKLFSWDGVAKEWCKDLFYGETIKKPMPLVSVICTTIRPAMFRVLKDQMDKQTYKNIELIVVDGRYDERKDLVADHFSKVKYPVLHIPDPDRDKTKYPYGICHACNAALYVANGELLVFLQDFIEIEADAIERFVDLYRVHPEMIYTGVDERWGFKADTKDVNDPIDIFKGGKYELTDKQYTSRRIRIGGAIRKSVEPMEWELNWAAAPKAALLSVGGWDNDWDKAFGYDNTEIALRFIYNGGMMLVDETNLAKALSHWDIWEHDEAGVPDRTKKTNDQRYAVYKRYLAETYDVSVVKDFKEPSYPDHINTLIKQFKK